MIALASDHLIFELANGESIPCSAEMITIEIVGESEPTPVWGTVGSFPLQQNGTIIKSLATQGAAVISASPSPNSVFGAFSAVYVVLRNKSAKF